MAEPQLDLEQVRHVARLARLVLPDEALRNHLRHIDSILGYVQKLSQAQTGGVEPLAHALPVRNIFREDIPQPSLPLEKVLQNAPETDGRFFKVPKVIGADDDSAE